MEDKLVVNMHGVEDVEEDVENNNLNDIEVPSNKKSKKII